MVMRQVKGGAAAGREHGRGYDESLDDAPTHSHAGPSYDAPAAGSRSRDGWPTRPNRSSMTSRSVRFGRASSCHCRSWASGESAESGARDATEGEPAYHGSDLQALAGYGKTT